MMEKICHADVFAVSFPNLRECALEITNIPTRSGIFEVTPGEPLTVQFRYITGNPPAFAFGLLFFATFNDAIQLKNALVRNLPDFSIDPIVPQPDTEDWQEGTITIEYPEDYPIPEPEIVSLFFYGTLVMNAPNHPHT